MRDCNVKYWLHTGSSWKPMYDDKRKQGNVLSKLYVALVVVVLLLCMTFMACLSGYAVGYNDRYAEVVAKYKITKARR